jgi:hypothetical protein
VRHPSTLTGVKAITKKTVAVKNGIQM